MVINDELIACYVEGTATIEERDAVRKYLSLHPEEYERVLCLMDNDIECKVEDNDIRPYGSEQDHDSSFYDVAYSAAAFAPQQKGILGINKISLSDKKGNLLERLNNMLDDVNK